MALIDSKLFGVLQGSAADKARTPPGWVEAMGVDRAKGPSTTVFELVSTTPIVPEPTPRRSETVVVPRAARFRTRVDVAFELDHDAAGRAFEAIRSHVDRIQNQMMADAFLVAEPPRPRTATIIEERQMEASRWFADRVDAFVYTLGLRLETAHRLTRLAWTDWVNRAGSGYGMARWDDAASAIPLEDIQRARAAAREFIGRAEAAVTMPEPEGIGEPLAPPSDAVPTMKFKR